MYKRCLILFGCLVLSVNAFAAGNIFCNGLPSSSRECLKARNVLYAGALDGYVQGIAQYESRHGKTPDKKRLKSDAGKAIPLAAFNQDFQYCGETSKEMKIAQHCMLRRLFEKMSKFTQNK